MGCSKAKSVIRSIPGGDLVVLTLVDRAHHGVKIGAKDVLPDLPKQFQSIEWAYDAVWIRERLNADHRFGLPPEFVIAPAVRGVYRQAAKTKAQ